MFKFETGSAYSRIEHLLDEAYKGIQRVEKLTTLLGSYPSRGTGLQEVSIFLQSRINEENAKIQTAFQDVKDVLLWLETKNI